MFEERQTKPYQHLPNFSTIRYPNNSEYSGQVFEGKRQGKGRLFNNVMDFFDGEWVNDELNGKGICQMPNGDRYEGDFQQGKFHGIGTLFYSNKCWYKGNFANGKKHGSGTETSPSGMTYTGQFLNDKPNGHGVQVKGDYSYEGEFVDGVKEGYGKEFYKEANYTGHFLKGQKHGKGILTQKNGSIYKGDWQLGQKQGFAVETKVEIQEGSDKKVKETYEGEFAGGYRDGFGRLIFNDNGSYWYGYWHRGLKTGTCLLYTGDKKEYFLQEFDYGKPKGKQTSINKPKPEEDGFRMIIEESVIKGEKVYDNDFSFTEMVKAGEKYANLDLQSVDWMRLSDLMSPSVIQFFPDDVKQTIELSKYSNYQLLTVLEALLDYPSQLLKFFSPQYSTDLGYYILKFFIHGKWRQFLIDDQIPVDREERTPLSSSLGAKKNVGLHLIEKAWAKFTKGYFSCYTNALKPEYVIEILTGLSPQHLSFSQSERNNSWESLTSDKNKRYKAKFVVPTKEFAQSMNLPPGYFYIFVDYLTGETSDLVRLKSVDKARILESKWNDIESWPSRMIKRLRLMGLDETNEEGTFWLESEKFLELFEYALICPLQEGYSHCSFLRKGNFEETTHHEMRFFEFDVPFKTPISMVVSQIVEKNDPYAPIRVILTKKHEGNLQYEYIFGRGQFITMNMHKLLVLDGGTYTLCVHIEHSKEIIRGGQVDIGVVFYTPTSVRLKPEVENIPQFLNKAYSSCAKKYGEKTDLGKFQNGSDKLVFYELFRAEDGVFVQHFVNGSDKIIWKYNANFTLTNMRIVGLPEHRQQVDISVEPKRIHTLLIMQTGGKSFEFLGGQGSVNLEVIDKSSSAKKLF